MADNSELLRCVTFLKPLTDEALDAFADAIHEVAFAPGTRFITEGHVEDDAYLIVDGIAEVSVRGSRVRTLGRGDVVGEMAAVSSRPRSASVSAATRVRALVLTGEFLRDLMRKHPAVSAVLSREMSSRASG